MAEDSCCSPGSDSTGGWLGDSRHHDTGPVSGALGLRDARARSAGMTETSVNRRTDPLRLLPFLSKCLSEELAMVVVVC